MEADSPRFATTRWSMVLAAGDAPGPESKAALEELCAAYWFPLFAWARRRGIDDADARDFVQGFFARLLARSALSVADPRRGRFRSFLLTSFGNYLANEYDRATALKRGGGRAVFSLAGDGDEPSGRSDPSHDETAERLFFRDWAVTLLEQVLGTLREEYESRGRGDLFRELSPALGGGGEKTTGEIAAELETTEGAIRVALHRLRRRYREELRSKIGDTVERPEDVEDEISRLFTALGQK